MARKTHRKVVILHLHPLTTSARKVYSYTPRGTCFQTASGCLHLAMADSCAVTP